MRHDVSLCDGCHFPGGVITNSLQSLDPYTARKIGFTQIYSE